jgi:hemerythrin
LSTGTASGHLAAPLAPANMTGPTEQSRSPRRVGDHGARAADRDNGSGNPLIAAARGKGLVAAGRGIGRGRMADYMEWNEAYSVGVAVFDDEHKKLVAILNELHAGLRGEIDKLALQRISDKLVDHALMHFRHEEMYFDDWSFPEAAAHIADHAKLRQQVFDYRNQILDKDSRELALEMLNFLCQWLGHHIMVEDRQYGIYLRNKGVR